MANKPIGPIWTNEFDGPNYTDPDNATSGFEPRIYTQTS
jgi:hypothetical protein